ncbi:hypothetical protein BC829DRAFT_208387 [Chytridium lagenaria]|nr:hypothetical protein BC829DRAFT_208387 [Chytridium lagenaria]
MREDGRNTSFSCYYIFRQLLLTLSRSSSSILCFGTHANPTPTSFGTQLCKAFTPRSLSPEMTAPLSASPNHHAAAASAAESLNAHQTDEPKVNSYEVGWLFVQQYYTFLNKEPHKLHCFYNTKSKFIHGTEGESPETQEGQKAIHQRIIDLDFQDCKVLVSNVDSQPSHDGCIVIMVLGEMSNKGGASHKFAQTFVLAQQPSGYFVFNDMFRFLKEDIDNEYEDPVDPIPEYQNETTISYEDASISDIPVEVIQEAPVVPVRSPSPVKETVQVPEPQPVEETPTQPTEQYTYEEVPEPAKWEPEPVEVAPAKPANWSAPKAKPEPEVKRNASPARPAETPAPEETPNPKPKSWAGVATANTHNWTPEHVSPAKGQVAAIPAGSKGGNQGPRQNYNQNQNQGQRYNNQNKQGGQQRNAEKAPAAAAAPAAPVAAGEEERAVSPQTESQGEFREVPTRRPNHDNRNNRNNAGGGERQNTGPSDDVIKRSICLKSIDGLSKEAIREAFSKVGKVVDVVIPSGKPNMAFIEFDNSTSASSSIGKTFAIGGVNVVPDVRRPKANPNNRNFDNQRGGHSARGREVLAVIGVTMATVARTAVSTTTRTRPLRLLPLPPLLKSEFHAVKSSLGA